MHHGLTVHQVDVIGRRGRSRAAGDPRRQRRREHVRRRPTVTPPTAPGRPPSPPRPTLPPVEAPTGFADLGVPPRIDDGLAAAGFAQPFAIQTEAIPVAMLGRDVCGRARTGSGKTLAFGVPMMARILDEAEPTPAARSRPRPHP